MLRFTIRDMLLLTAIGALLLGWALDRTRLAQTNRELTTQRDRLVATKTQWVVQRELLQQRIENVGPDGSKTP